MDHKLRTGHSRDPKDLPFAGNPITSHEDLMDHYFVHPSACTDTTEGPLHASGHDLEHYMH